MGNRTQHPVEVHGVQELLDDGLEVHEMSLRDILTEILIEMKKINLHLASMVDEEIDMEDTGDDN